VSVVCLLSYVCSLAFYEPLLPVLKLFDYPTDSVTAGGWVLFSDASATDVGLSFCGSVCLSVRGSVGRNAFHILQARGLKVGMCK